MTCGCFDLMHPGHVVFLSRAATIAREKKCTQFIALVNSDEWVAHAKSRQPVFPATHRALLVEAVLRLSFDSFMGDRTQVECRVFDSESDIVDTIRTVRPKLFFKGDDWAGKTITGAEELEACGGSLILLPRISSLSTSSILNNLRSTGIS